MTARQDEILQALEEGRELDDDQIAELIDANRHYVNAVCRALAGDGLIERKKDPLLGKIVNRATGTERQPVSVPTASASGMPPRTARRTSSAQRARQNVDELVQNFDACLRHFESSNTFPGPSLYFHEQAIARRRTHPSVADALADERFLEYVYAVLPAWGMHRMGKHAAKVGDFGDMVASFRECGDLLEDLASHRATSVQADAAQELAEALWDIINRLRVSTSRARIVAGSKALHHVLPDLVPPIDRQYTFQFFTGQKSLYRGERVAFLEWFPLLCEIATRSAGSIEAAMARGGFMATGEAKIVDNAIIGFMQRLGQTAGGTVV